MQRADTPVLVAARAAGRICGRVARRCGERPRNAEIPLAVAGLLFEIPIDLFALGMITDSRVGADVLGKGCERARFRLALGRTPHKVFARGRKYVFPTLSPPRVEIHVEVHAVRIGFPEGKIFPAVQPA